MEWPVEQQKEPADTVTVSISVEADGREPLAQCQGRQSLPRPSPAGLSQVSKRFPRDGGPLPTAAPTFGPSTTPSRSV